MKTISYIFSYEREKELKRIVQEHIKNNVDFIIVDDGSSFINDEYWNQFNIMKYDHTGKFGFINKYNDVFEHFINSDYDNIICLAEDLYNIDFEYINMISEVNINDEYIFNILTDSRKTNWINIDPIYLSNFVERLYFTDCAFITNKQTIKKLYPLILPNNWFNKENKSSGVGYLMSHKCLELEIPIYRRIYSCCEHDSESSVMHPEERKNNPLIDIKRPIIVCNIVTMNSRKETLKHTLDSLNKQTIKPDIINVYNNDENEIDYTDNAKFLFLKEYNEPVYYFTMDDDIIYSEDYIEKTIDNIERHKCIITYHGRILNNKFKDYYADHIAFSCKKEYNIILPVDVAGTGVTAFRTDYFNPVDIYKSEYKRMSDVVFSHEARKQNKDIILVSNSDKPKIVLNDMEQDFSCYEIEKRNTTNQNKLCEEIYKMKKTQ